MKNLEIPDYETLIPNSTFGKQEEQVRIKDTRISIPATQIIHISRYRSPLEKEVLDSIRKYAHDCYSQQLEDEENPLNQFLKMFPRSELKKISNGNRYSMMHLKEHYRIKKEENEREEGKNYLQIAHGVVPSEVLDKFKKSELEKKVKEILYQKMIHDFGEEEWYLIVKLEENKFPNLLELEYLIGHKVKDCDIFEIIGNCKYEKFVNEVRTFCGIFETSGDVEKVEEGSELKLKSTAANVLQHTINCLISAKVIKGATRRMGINADIINAQHPNLREEENDSPSKN